MPDYNLQSFNAQDQSVTIGYSVNSHCAIEKAYKFHTGSPRKADTKISIFQEAANDSGFTVVVENQKKDNFVAINGCVPELRTFLATQDQEDGVTTLYLKNVMTTRVSLMPSKPSPIREKKFYKKF